MAERATRLVALRHAGFPGAAVELGVEPILCGRSAGQLRFPGDPTVSPEHARFEPRGEGWAVADLGSANGTFVRLRSSHPLAVGDEVRLGRQLLRREAMPPAPATAGARTWGGADPGHRFRLVQLLEGGGEGEAFPLTAGENGVGREAARVCFPTDRFVSGRHARLDVEANGVVLTDLGSSNGTFVRAAGPEPILSGDQILIGLQLVCVE
jgi:pSer/pThr/pTyr-binding forkhead associated (FHA) protein